MNLIRGRSSIDGDDFILGPKILDDGHARLFKGAKAFLDAFRVVVGSARGLAPVREPVQHHLDGTVEEEGEAGWADGGFEVEGLIHFAGKAYGTRFIKDCGVVWYSSGSQADVLNEPSSTSTR